MTQKLILFALCGAVKNTFDFARENQNISFDIFICNNVGYQHIYKKSGETHAIFAGSWWPPEKQSHHEPAKFFAAWQLPSKEASRFLGQIV